MPPWCWKPRCSAPPTPDRCRTAHPVRWCAGQRRHGQHLKHLQAQWQGRGVELVVWPRAWRFQTRPEVRDHLIACTRQTAALQPRGARDAGHDSPTRQPVTRGDIEAFAASPSAAKSSAAARRPWLDRRNRLPRNCRPPRLAGHDAPVFGRISACALWLDLPLLDPQGDPAEQRGAAGRLATGGLCVRADRSSHSRSLYPDLFAEDGMALKTPAA